MTCKSTLEEIFAFFIELLFNIKYKEHFFDHGKVYLNEKEGTPIEKFLQVSCPHSILKVTVSSVGAFCEKIIFVFPNLFGWQSVQHLEE